MEGLREELAAANDRADEEQARCTGLAAQMKEADEKLLLSVPAAETKQQVQCTTGSAESSMASPFEVVCQHQSMRFNFIMAAYVEQLFAGANASNPTVMFLFFLFLLPFVAATFPSLRCPSLPCSPLFISKFATNFIFADQS